MSEFEKGLVRMRTWSGDDYTDGLRTVAEGLAEIIGLLRPLVDTITAQPEPLKLGGWIPRCDATQAHGQCGKPAAHYGDHDNGHEQWPDTEYEFTAITEEKVRRHQRCGAIGPTMGRGPWGVRKSVCGMHADHEGKHVDADNAETRWV